MDRYAYSGVAYSAAKGLDYEWCWNCDKGLPKPDVVFFMDLDPVVAAARRDYGSERYEKAAFQQSVRMQFEKMMPGFVRIDASQSIQDIALDVSKAITSIVQDASSRQVDVL